MQRFDRSSEPPPRLLQSKEFHEQRQMMLDHFMMEQKRRDQTRVPNLRVDLNHKSVNEALHRLFHGKCAFCESYSHVVPYQFRPVSDAIPAARRSESGLYYAWLNSAWENIYPICEGCQPERAEYFPVKGRRAPIPAVTQIQTYMHEGLGLWRDHPPKEKNLLLDPCEDGFVRHFSVGLDGYLFPNSDRAEETINHFNLNRDDLYQVRGERMTEYFNQLVGIVVPLMHRGEYQSARLFGFLELEFGGLWYLMCRKILLFLTNDNSHRWPLSPNRIEQTFQKLAKKLGGEIKREELAEWINDPLANAFSEDSHLARSLTDNPPTLASISLINFKGIEQLDMHMPAVKAVVAEPYEFPEPALLILGENAAGKSSILEAIALALATDDARHELKLDISALPLDPQLMGDRSASRREKATVSLTFDDGSIRVLSIGDGKFSVEGGPEVPPIFAYGAFRQYQKQTTRYSHGKSVVNLFHSDRLLSNPEKWLLSLEEYDFDNVVKALRIILSIEGDFDVMERDFETQRCLIVTAAPGNHAGSRTPLSLASSGYRSMLAMVCDIIQGLMSVHSHTFFESLETARAVVLIDEVEAHLHPRWKIQIMKALRTALPRVTFIVTTHDPLCLRGMGNGEVVVMHRVSSESRTESEWPTMVERIVHLPDVSKLTIEQLLTSDFFGLASTDQPGTERALAMFADLLSVRENGRPLTEDQQLAWARFEQDVSQALPVGTTEIQRLIQEAVAEYLKNRRQVSADNLSKLRDESRKNIVAILESI